MNILILISIFTFLAAEARSQVSLKLGHHYNNFYWGEMNSTNAGVHFSFPLTKNLSVEPAIMASRSIIGIESFCKAVTFSPEGEYYSYTDKIMLNNFHVALPLNISFSINKQGTISPFISTGGAFYKSMAGKAWYQEYVYKSFDSTHEKIKTERVNNNLSYYEFGAETGGKLKLREKVSLSLSFGYYTMPEITDFYFPVNYRMNAQLYYPIK